MNRGVACLVLLTHLCAAAAAGAGPTEEEDLLAQGSELRRAGRDEEALGVFARALASSGSPRARAQVALAEQALGRWVDAERELSVALSATEDSWIGQHREALAPALSLIRTHLATLEVDSNVGGANLFVNGSLLGSLPLEAPVRVVAGTLTIEVRAPGFEPQLRTIVVAPQSRAREVMTLVKSLMPPVPIHEKDPASLDASISNEGSGTTRTAAWISVAATAALVAGGTAALVVETTMPLLGTMTRGVYP